MFNKKTTTVYERATQAYVLGQHISMSAHKARRVIDQIRGRSYEETLMILELMPYRACYPIFKLVYSAAANASVKIGSNEANLVISKAEVNEGTIVKRLKPRARGRSFAIQKPICHITIVMKDISFDRDTDSITWSQKPKWKKRHTPMSYYDMYSNEVFSPRVATEGLSNIVCHIISSYEV